MNLRTNLRRATTLVAGLALAAGLAGTTPVGAAQADPGSPPVAVDDVVEVYAGSFTSVDVLANDSDPDGDELAVCRLGDLPRRLSVFVEEDQLVVLPETLEPRTFTFTYYACDFDSLTPATVTVNVVKPPKVRLKVRKTERPGQLRVTNRNDYGIDFLWGSAREDEADGQVRIKERSSTIVKVQRRSILWLAANVRREAFRLGVVRGIELPKGSEVLPPGAPTEDMGMMAGRRGVPDWSTP